MPEICRFYGLVMTMYWNDHNPPHFHARYGEWTAEIDIQTLALLQGSLPPRAMAMTIEWALKHQEELRTQWERARHQQLAIHRTFVIVAVVCMQFHRSPIARSPEPRASGWNLKMDSWE